MVQKGLLGPTVFSAEGTWLGTVLFVAKHVKVASGPTLSCDVPAHAVRPLHRGYRFAFLYGALQCVPHL